MPGRGKPLLAAVTHTCSAEAQKGSAAVAISLLLPAETNLKLHAVQFGNLTQGLGQLVSENLTVTLGLAL